MRVSSGFRWCASVFLDFYEGFKGWGWRPRCKAFLVFFKVWALRIEVFLRFGLRIAVFLKFLKVGRFGDEVSSSF